MAAEVVQENQQNVPPVAVVVQERALPANYAVFANYHECFKVGEEFECECGAVFSDDISAKTHVAQTKDEGSLEGLLNLEGLEQMKLYCEQYKRM